MEEAGAEAEKSTPLPLMASEPATTSEPVVLPVDSSSALQFFNMPHHLGIGFGIMNVSEVDLQAQTFQCAFLLRVFYLEPSLRERSKEAGKTLVDDDCPNLIRPQEAAFPNLKDMDHLALHSIVLLHEVSVGGETVTIPGLVRANYHVRGERRSAAVVFSSSPPLHDPLRQARFLST